MSGSTARTDDGIKNLDNWLNGLGFNWREDEALDAKQTAILDTYKRVQQAMIDKDVTRLICN